MKSLIVAAFIVAIEREKLNCCCKLAISNLTEKFYACRKTTSENFEFDLFMTAKFLRSEVDCLIISTTENKLKQCSYTFLS